jgi:hypothetical protein
MVEGMITFTIATENRRYLGINLIKMFRNFMKNAINTKRQKRRL